MTNRTPEVLTEYQKRIIEIASMENNYHLRIRLRKVNELFHQKINTAQKLENNWDSQEYRAKINNLDNEIKELLFL